MFDINLTKYIFLKINIYYNKCQLYMIKLL